MKLRRLLFPVVNPTCVLALTAAASLALLAGVVLRHTLHVFTFAHVTVVQFGDSIAVGVHGHGPPVFTFQGIALLLALPGIGWGTWWLIHWDAKK